MWCGTQLVEEIFCYFLYYSIPPFLMERCCLHCDSKSIPCVLPATLLVIKYYSIIESWNFFKYFLSNCAILLIFLYCSVIDVNNFTSCRLSGVFGNCIFFCNKRNSCLVFHVSQLYFVNINKVMFFNWKFFGMFQYWYFDISISINFVTSPTAPYSSYIYCYLSFKIQFSKTHYSPSTIFSWKPLVNIPFFLVYAI